MSTRSHIYHIYMRNKGKDSRTTISVDNMLSEMLQLKLGEKPGTQESHSVAREWLQKTYDNNSQFIEDSRFFRLYILRELVEKRLYEKWINWEQERDTKR